MWYAPPAMRASEIKAELIDSIVPLFMEHLNTRNPEEQATLITSLVRRYGQRLLIRELRIWKSKLEAAKNREPREEIAS